MNIAEAKKIDLVEYLAGLGHHPSKIKKEDYWYRSPFREEKTASFKVNRESNVWFDHGTGQGGNFVDFALQYHNCTPKELLENLSGNFSFHQRPIHQPNSEEPAIKILSEKSLVSLSLIRYIKQRRVAEEMARKYCREISFSVNDKTHSAIGFRNDEGGFELRNQWFKGSSSPKAVTHIESGSKELAVFEGFFDFLSHRTIYKNDPLNNTDFLILNSTTFFEKSRMIMEQHDTIRLFLDQDKGGLRCTRQALGWSNKYRDESHLYKGYKDLNEWMQQIGKSQRQGFKQT